MRSMTCATHGSFVTTATTLAAPTFHRIQEEAACRGSYQQVQQRSVGSVDPAIRANS